MMNFLVRMICGNKKRIGGSKVCWLGDQYITLSLWLSYFIYAPSQNTTGLPVDECDTRNLQSIYISLLSAAAHARPPQ